jgi:hemerythrin-like metal-binding protein
MSEGDQKQIGRLFYTGTSRFLDSNEYFVQAMLNASSHCAIHASEDIFDANGLKLWASGQAIGDRLLERLSNRRLRKPIELCVYAADPVAVAGIVEAIERCVANLPDLSALLEPHLADVLKTVGAIVPNPTELMLFSIMHHGGREMFNHAALVTALALAASDIAGSHPDLRRALARSALLHDVGELYLPPALLEAPHILGAKQVREQRSHAAIGGQVAVELARSSKLVGELIAHSHERLDGWGYPLGLTVADLSLPSQALLFAEAMVRSIEVDANGLRRAAVAARLVPGEFPQDMVDWIVRCGNSRPAHRLASGFPDAIALDLRQAHSVLTRTRLLLESSFGPRETSAVQLAAARWLKAVLALVNELRRTGVDSALVCNMDIEPQDDLEVIELGVLSQELVYRVRELCSRVALEQAESVQLASSALVIDLLDILRACEPSTGSNDVSDPHGQSRVELLPWSDLYCVGVRDIDDQHRALVGLLNRLAQKAQEGNESDAVDKALAALVDYVQLHFRCEEALMRAHHYAEEKSHIEVHTRLNGRLQGMLARRQQDGFVSVDELMTFLRQWLISHILHTDRDLGIALNNMGIH